MPRRARKNDAGRLANRQARDRLVARRSAGLALALLLAGGLLTWKQRQDDAHLLTVRGEVVAMDSVCSGGFPRRGGPCTRFPWVRTVSATGQRFVFRSSVGQPSAMLAQGQVVRVRYDPRDADPRSHAFIVGYGWRYASLCYHLALAAAAVSAVFFLATRAGIRVTPPCRDADAGAQERSRREAMRSAQRVGSGSL